MVLDRQSLLSALSDPDPLAMAARADALRRSQHGATTSYVLLRTLDWGSGERFSPLSGLDVSELSTFGAPAGPASELGTALLERAHPAAGDYQVLPRREIASSDLVRYADACANALGELALPGVNGGTGSAASVVPTFQLGTADLWIEAGSDEGVLGEARAAGLRVISDGVRPRHHPGHGAAGAESWSSFWLAAGRAGLKGNATLLYGPSNDTNSLLDQLEAITRVQRECGVFASLAPVIHNSAQRESPSSPAVTQGLHDLRVFAACRLSESGIEHLRMLYACSDLKMAHLSLACGVDDLEGYLFDGKRTPREVADSFDLNLDEIEAWLVEAGYEPVLRNGVHEVFPRESDEA
jgi:hypothetical protein